MQILGEGIYQTWISGAEISPVLILEIEMYLIWPLRDKDEPKWTL